MIRFKPGIQIGFNLTLHDIIFVYFLWVSFKRYYEYSHYFKYDLTLNLFFYSLLFIAVAIPFFIVFNGDEVMRTINFAREFLMFIPAFLYFFSFSYGKQELEKITDGFLRVGFIIGLISLPLVIQTGDRVLGSQGTFFISLVGLVSLCKYYEKGKMNLLFLSLFMLLLALVMRHRSVWIATALGLVYIHFYLGVNKKVLGIVVSGIAIIFALSFVFPGYYNKFYQAIDESASPLKSQEGFDESTGGGRVSRWQQQIKDKWTWGVPIWGIGHAYDRDVTFKFKSGKTFKNAVSFHNHYLEQAFRVGGISVVILLLFIFKFLWLNHQLRRWTKEDYLMLSLSASIFATVGYGMIYNFPYFIYILMGIGYSILLKKDESSYSDSDLQQKPGNRKLALDAWKHQEAS